ncbi:MAG: hypothetical protein O7D94_05510 [Planctomycetota bacterium]|nr:hypothetical protein [Planctomycetota bacterium]
MTGSALHRRTVWTALVLLSVIHVGCNRSMPVMHGASPKSTATPRFDRSAKPARANPAEADQADHRRPSKWPKKLRARYS